MSAVIGEHIPLWAIVFITNTALLGVIFLVARQFEKTFPAKPESIGSVVTDWKLAALKWTSSQLFSPMAKACGLILVNAAGAGWIQLRADGWWFLLSALVVILTLDFVAYVTHRAQHKFPVLWSMHSLHHSADSLSAVTGARHFWLEDPLFSICVLPILGILFKIPAEMATPILLLYFIPDSLAHLNIRLSLGRFALCLNNPQYHRIHHSIEPQHYDKNFCKMLPLMDMIFGTAWAPGRDEFPMTGLPSREQPTGILDGIIWPLRHRLSWAH